MAGNVWEWVEDCYHNGYHASPPLDGSVWTAGCEDAVAVVRGGGFSHSRHHLRTAGRYDATNWARVAWRGARCARACDDRDGDGHDTCEAANPIDADALPPDCDDADPSAHPSAAEVCDGRDNDCDGETDEDTAPEGWVCVPPTGPEGFWMGSPEDEPGRRPHWERQHRVVLTRGLLVQATEVTIGQWRELLGEVPPAHGNCVADDCPAQSVSWYAAVDYVNALSRRDGLEECYDRRGEYVYWPAGLRCEGYRLPTEVEWEYLARAGTTTAYYTGDILDGTDDCHAEAGLDAAGWYCANSGSRPHPVGEKQPNAWGLYDVLGNVSEWAWDGESQGQVRLDAVDPLGTVSKPRRVVRGGSG